METKIKTIVSWSTLAVLMLVVLIGGVMLVNDKKFEDVPAVLETPKEGMGDEGNLALLRKLRGE